jgi:hypothetical protein
MLIQPSHVDRNDQPDSHLLIVPLACTDAVSTDHHVASDNNVQHGARDKQHALRPRSTSHLRKREQDRDGTSSMHCNPVQHNIITGHQGTSPRRDGPQWPALACLPNSTTPAVFSQRQIILHSLLAFSVSVSVYLCLSLYLSIYRYQSILPYYHIFTNSLHSFLSLQYH